MLDEASTEIKRFCEAAYVFNKILAEAVGSYLHKHTDAFTDPGRTRNFYSGQLRCE